METGGVLTKEVRVSSYWDDGFYIIGSNLVHKVTVRTFQFPLEKNLVSKVKNC